MADATTLFANCAARYSQSPQATTDAANVAIQYASGQRGIPTDVAARGATRATERVSVSNTLGCFSEALLKSGNTNHAMAGVNVGRANLEYAQTVRAVYDALRAGR